MLQYNTNSLLYSFSSMQAKYQEMFREFGALEQLSKLDKLRSDQSTSSHPWYVKSLLK